MNSKTQKMSIKTMTFGALLTALVIVLQLMGSFIRFGQFSVSLVLIPIVIGSAIGGPYMGTWLGAVFGATVLASGDAAAFLTIDAIGTVITVILKGTACGFVAGLIYKLFEKKNQTVAVISAAIICPVVNTLIFIAGCFLFFYDTISTWASDGNAVKYIFLVLVGGNFLFELAFNIILSPTIIKLLNYTKKNI
ncbi:MAG: ECF transporter S component [Oscillospiraceae bacterium]|nr:ECF transporter S component [Oscillospiraceae bacterium]